MDITAHNFKENLDLIKKAINEATFLTIDAEFTGLYTSKTLHAFDTPEERYAKLRKGAMDFLLIQFGLCTFTCNDELKRYEHKAFNFYVFPKQSKRSGPDICFMCQSSSLDFLFSQGFDFNKLFKDGVSYLSPTDECKLREQLEQKHYQQDNVVSSQFDSSQHDDSSPRSQIPIPDQHKSFIDDVCKKIQDFMDSDEEALSLEPCNAFLRKLIFQTVKQRYPTGLYLESKSTPKKEWYIAITKANAEKLKEMELAKKNSELEELDDSVGFAKIIKLISSSGKLIVGHNMLLDVLHIIHKFCSPLPTDIEDFKAITKCVFPRIIDTKLMASTFPFKDKITKTILGVLLKTLEKTPFSMPTVVVTEGFKGYNTGDEQLHEAGYDAYITGLCFLSMAKYLDTLRNSHPKTLQLNWSLLEPFINKLYMMQVHDIPYMNLVGEDLKPNRDHVFHVRFPKDWKTSDLMQLFGPFGHVNVFWVDDISAFVALERKDQAALVMRTLTQSDIYHVLSYKEYARLQKKPNPYDAMHKDEVEVHNAKRQLSDNTTTSNKGRKRSRKHTWSDVKDEDNDKLLKDKREDEDNDDDDDDGDDHSKGDHSSDDKDSEDDEKEDDDEEDEKDEEEEKEEEEETTMASGQDVDGGDKKRKKFCQKKVMKKKVTTVNVKATDGVFDVPSDW